MILINVLVNQFAFLKLFQRHLNNASNQWCLDLIFDTIESYWMLLVMFNSSQIPVSSSWLISDFTAFKIKHLYPITTFYSNQIYWRSLMMFNTILQYWMSFVVFNVSPDNDSTHISMSLKHLSFSIIFYWRLLIMFNTFFYSGYLRSRIIARKLPSFWSARKLI